MRVFDSINNLLKNQLCIRETADAKRLINQMNIAKEKGFFTKKFLFELFDWKSPRSKGVGKKNTNLYVKQISKKFFHLVGDKERMDCLKKLHGVGIPVASAILTVMDPKNYGVIDYHVWQALFQFEYVREKKDGKNLSVKNWLQFLKILRSLAQQHKVNVRDIERTLFDYHRDLDTPDNWEELRKKVKNCQYNCPRNKDKFKILFDREESSLSKIKFIVVSQEPGYSLKKQHDFKNSMDVEEFLISECLKEPDNKRTPIIRIKDIFNRKKFNPATDEIYWTHTLKCIPKESDKGIHKAWRNCASTNCVKHFKNEIKLIPSRNLIVIPMGNYALTFCRHILEDYPLKKVTNILDFIEKYDFKKEYSFNEKKIFLFPFVHPSKRDMVLKNKDHIKDIEKKFIEKIRELQ